MGTPAVPQESPLVLHDKRKRARLAETDSRSCWVSIDIWPSPTQHNTRVTDWTESPWRTDPAINGRLLDRAEVLREVDRRVWVFAMIDVIVAQSQTVHHFLGA